MHIKDSLLVELERETLNTRRILENLNDESLGWKPHEKSMSLGSLATHIIELANMVYDVFTREKYDFMSDYQANEISTVSGLVQLLDEGYKSCRKVLLEANEEEFGANFELKAGDYIIANMSKADIIRYWLYNHLIHHRGQLTVYMRLLNIPLPGLYGPSADER